MRRKTLAEVEEALDAFCPGPLPVTERFALAAD
jgi:hypothetical protein